MTTGFAIAAQRRYRFVGQANAAPTKNRRSPSELSADVRELYASPIPATTWEEDLLFQRTLTGPDHHANIDNAPRCYTI